MHNHKALLSSARQDWETPPALFETLQREFPFVRDIGACARNHLLPDYIGRGEDALDPDTRWGKPGDVVYCNPPYGRDLGLWAARAVEMAYDGVTVVMLVPARTDTRWWIRLAASADDIRLLPGRLKFRLNKQELHPAPFPSAVVILRPIRRIPWPVSYWDWSRA